MTVPGGIAPTSLFATFTESVSISYPYMNSYYNNCCSNYGYDCSYSNYYTSGCYNYPSNYYYPYIQYSYVTTSDTAVSPLSYVNATTPQYLNLQSQYQNQKQQLAQAQTQNQNLKQVNEQSQEVSQLQTQVKQLQQSLQNQQNAISQKDSTNFNLAAQLTNASTTG